MKKDANNFQKNSEFTVDFHTHSSASLDGDKTINFLIKRAKEQRNSMLAVSDHNTIHGVNRFLDKKGVPREEVMELIDSKLIFLPATEITCRVSAVPNYKGNSSKIHLLAYGINRDDSIPLSKLLKIKHENDGKVDRGYLTQLQKYFNIDFSDIDIIKYITEKKKTKKGFGTFGVQDTLEFATAQNLHLTNSIEELRSIISEFRPTARLNLEAEDVINLIHAAGGLAILAHPNTNLRRTSKPKELLNYLIGKGIDGFEMYYPGNTNQSDNMVREMINKSGKKFLFTGGSDYHSDELYELEYKNLITYTPPTISKVKEFIDNMYELKIAREKGDLLVKDYKALKKFNAKKVVKHYSEMSAFIDVESEDFLR